MNTCNPEFCCGVDCHKSDFNDEQETISVREMLMKYNMMMTEAKIHTREDYYDMWDEGNYKNEE